MLRAQSYPLSCPTRNHDDNADDGGKMRIGRYDTTSRYSTFACYPLDVRESPNGGWVGRSEITALGGDEFAVVERDNQANDGVDDSNGETQLLRIDKLFWPSSAG